MSFDIFMYTIISVIKLIGNTIQVIIIQDLKSIIVFIR